MSGMSSNAAFCSSSNSRDKNRDRSSEELRLDIMMCVYAKRWQVRKERKKERSSKWVEGSELELSQLH